jgi:hypothetical protein
MTHDWYGRSNLYPMGKLTNTRHSDGAPHPSSRPNCFYPLSVNTSDRLYDDFIRLLFLHADREESALTKELPEETDQFFFRHATCLTNLKGSVGLILAKVWVMRFSIPLDLSSRFFIPLPRFIRSRRPISSRPFPRTFSSTLCLNDTCWVSIFS